MDKFFSVALGAALASLLWWAWPIPWPWGTDKFLGQEDFSGAPANVSPVVNGYQSTFNGIVTFNNVDLALVSNLLPNGYELSPRLTSKLPNKHPVVILFGDQTDGAGVFNGSSVPPYSNRIHYSEIVVLVPFVQKSGDPAGKWHNYVARMYLDNTVPITGGLFYGYNKQPAIINWAGEKAHVRKAYFSGSDLLNGEFKWFGNWYSGASARSYLKNFDDGLGILATTILGDQRWLDEVICSHWEWNLDNAKIARASTEFRIESSFRSDMVSWPAYSPFVSEDDSAFYVKGVQWRLANPESCSTQD